MSAAGQVDTSAGAVDLAARRLTLLGHLQILLDYVGGTNPIYVGRALPGTLTSDPRWAIRKLTYDLNGNVTAIQWANATIAYAWKWDDRAGLSYT